MPKEPSVFGVSAEDARLELATAIVALADMHEDQSNWEPSTSPHYAGRYRKSLSELSKSLPETWRTPAYLLLAATWNDALDWANEVLKGKKA